MGHYRIDMSCPTCLKTRCICKPTKEIKTLVKNYNDKQNIIVTEWLNRLKLRKL